MGKMATYVAKKGLLLFLLFAIIVSAKARKCHSCIGNQLECKSTEVTCPGSNDTCGSSVMVIESFLVKEQTVTKGCVSPTEPYRRISISPNELVKLSIEEKTCNTDLCNTETITDSKLTKNNMNCYACISPEKDCTSETLRNLNCRGQQNSCLDIRVLGNAGDISNSHIKGCGEMNCSGNMGFHSTRLSVIVKCCNENFCNSDLEFKAPDQTPNGVECYNCDTLSGDDCTPGNISKTQCYGSLTTCFESTGIRMKDGKPKPALLMGCATPNMCDNLVLPLLQKLKGSRVRCCNGSLCNNHFIENQASSYYTGSGIESSPTNQDSGVKKPQYIYNPIKTGHSSNNYGSEGSVVLTSAEDYDHRENGGYNVVSVLGETTVSPMTTGDKQNNLNSGSWNSNYNGGIVNPTSTFSYGLSGSNSNTISNPSATESAVTENVQSQTQVYNNDAHSTVGETTANVLLAGNENDTLYNIDVYSEENSNLTTTSQGPNKPQESWDIYSNSSKINASYSSSFELNNAPSGDENDQELFYDNIGQQDQQSIENTNVYSDDQESTDQNVFIGGSEADSYNYINIYSEEDGIIPTTTSQGSTGIEGNWDPDAVSESSYELNSNAFGSSVSVSTTNNSSSENNTVPSDSTNNYAIGVNSNPNTSSQGSSNNSYNEIPNFSTGGFENNVGHGNKPNKISPIKYNCSNSIGQRNPSGSQSQPNVSGSAVPTNNFVSNSQNVNSNLGEGISNSPLTDPNNGSSNNSIFNGSTHFVNSNNDSVQKSPVTSQGNFNSYNVDQSSQYATNVYNTSFALAGNVHGHGSSSSSSGYHNGENRDNSSNALSGSHKPEEYGNTMDYNSIVNGSDINPNITSEGGLYSNYNPNKPPVLNEPPQEYFYGNSYDNNNNIYGSEVNNYGNHYIPPGGSSHGGSNDSQNNNGGSFGISYPNMPPPMPGHNSNSENNTLNGSNSYGLPPGFNLSTNGNNSVLINMLSNATGLNPALLSERFNGADLSKPGILVSLLSGTPGFNDSLLPPQLKAAIFGYTSNVNPISYNTDRYNNNMLPLKLNISNLVNNSNFLNALSNMTNISTTELSQRLNEWNKDNQSNIPALLFGLPGFDPNKLPLEEKAEIFGTGTNPNYSHTGGLNYNMVPSGSSSANLDNLIQRLSTATRISPTILSQKLHGVDISNLSNLASVLPTIHGFDANQLPPDLRAAIFGYNSNLPNNIPNYSGYNNNMLPPKLNISNLVNNSNFLNALSNMTNISTTELSQRLNEWNKDNQSNLPALLLSLHGFDPQRLPPELREGIYGMNTNTTMPAGSNVGNSWNNGTYNTDLSLSGKNTNDSSTDSNANYNSAYSLKSKASFLAIIFMITLLLVN